MQIIVILSRRKQSGRKLCKSGKRRRLLVCLLLAAFLAGYKANNCPRNWGHANCNVMEPFRFERFARSRMCSPNDDISKKEKKTELGNQIKRLENSKMK